ncbi:MAG TPA: hypothetical protein VGX25_25660 [Actinophytocola sp.]|uniref:hypothetical protein n=1 Tax=Actinophytocola sp. TaxID=1872138 RepID=UPI002DDCDCAD|nr:hypothetical protein [Actinophytocola sp.]HEV2782792.1 hypothetical protein [Actinophytocola sp.]
MNRDLQLAVSDSDSALRLFDVMVFYPGWQLDVDRFGPFLFWLSNLRTILFVGLAVAGLARVSRWLRETASGAGVFVATVGVTVLSAAVAGMAAAVTVVNLVDEPRFFPTSDGRLTAEFFLAQLSLAGSFGVLFGLVLGGAVLMQRQGQIRAAERPKRPAQRRVDAPKSFW